jgi:PTH1 family peptidyl-tRNA hydrolase
MKNFVWLMKTQDFPRVRVGIGVSGETDMMNYVLTPFMREERAQIAQAADKVSDILEEIVRNGIDAAMNRYNTRQKTAEEEKTDVHE